MHVAVAIHVLAINVGHNRKNRRELQERSVAFIGLSNQILRATKPRIRSHGIDAPAHNDCRIKPARRQHRRYHGRGRRFAMHAGDGDAILQPHQFRQHFCALDHGNVQPPRFVDFRISRADCRAGDDNVGPGDVLRALTFKYDCTQAGQPIRHRRAFQIRAGNLVAKIQQHLGNPTHADAADAHKMHALDLGKHKSNSRTRIYADFHGSLREVRVAPSAGNISANFADFLCDLCG